MSIEVKGWTGNGHPSPDFVREMRQDHQRPSWEQYDIWLTDEQISLIERAVAQYQSPEQHYHADAVAREGLSVALFEGMGSNYTVEWEAARGLDTCARG